MTSISNICQSCGMPIDKDPKGGGTTADGRKSSLYCSFCFADGEFLDEGISLHDKIEKNVKMAVAMKIEEEKARRMAESILPKLKRWRE